MQQGVEVRWIVLGPDGRHVSLGRHCEPSEDEIRRAEAALRAAGTSGSLAVARGNPGLGARPPELLMVRPLAGALQAAYAWPAAHRLKIARTSVLTEFSYRLRPQRLLEWAIDIRQHRSDRQ
jgi:hypothetical protein